jgi:hypothetical protein
LIAIDIAKVRNEVLMEFPDKKRRKRLSVLNTREEHDHFIGGLPKIISDLFRCFSFSLPHHFLQI